MVKSVLKGVVFKTKKAQIKTIDFFKTLIAREQHLSAHRLSEITSFRSNRLNKSHIKI